MSKYTPKDRAPIKPRRVPELKEQVANDRIYATLYALWSSDISKNGPKESALVAVAGFKPDNLVYEIYQIWPATEKKNEAAIKRILQAIGDIMEFDGSQILLKASIIAALQPESGDLIWIGVAGGKCVSKDLKDVVGALSAMLGRQVVFAGPV